MATTYAGIVLAGGESRRYGTPKALEEIDGIPFYKKAIDILEPFVEHLVIVVHPSIRESIPVQKGVTIIMDEPKVKGEGPLAGIYSGMKAYEASHYLVLACDMPLMEGRIFKQLASIHAFLKPECSVIPCTENCVQPLAALYSSSILPHIIGLLKNKKRRLTDLFGSIDCIYVSYKSEEMITCFKNVNTPSDYTEISH
ncbi:molybdenum cofactor guanylyltransferase [Pseudalkalibacillus sp. A8]|uniref:molybdenum cofactor guanylyltransferase n=1 Tax=Pseudalkalibacillus sp. A8 TaxID=3382641 RepID=UPI0038B451C9